MASRLWPPVTVRVGANEIINQKVMKHEPSDTFNDFLTKIRTCSDSQRVARILICKNEKLLIQSTRCQLIFQSYCVNSMF